MVYLLLMTLAGTILLLLYFVWAKICEKFVSERMKYAALVLVLLAHVTPLMALRNVYRNLLDLLPPQKTAKVADPLMHVAEVSSATDAYITPDFRWIILVMAVWIGVAVLLLMKQCLEYFHKRIELKKVADACRSEVGVRIVERLRKEFHLKRRIDVLQVDSDNSPYTIGVFKPVVIITKKLNEDELIWALRHELTHIAQGDVMFKLLLELVCCLYWFDRPLRKFKEYFFKICELSCDAGVTNGCTDEERVAYSKVLVKTATRKKGVIMSNALADDEDIIQERIKIIMNSRKMKRWEKIIAVSVFVVFMLADSLVAFAYPNVYHVDDETDTAAAGAQVAGGDSLWMYDESHSEAGSQMFEVLYDIEFIDENGTIIPVNDIQPQAFCIGHNWQQGFVQTHEKNNNGGCSVYLYNAKLCPYCNSVVIESLYSTLTYVTCPH